MVFVSALAIVTCIPASATSAGSPTPGRTGSAIRAGSVSPAAATPAPGLSSASPSPDGPASGTPASEPASTAPTPTPAASAPAAATDFQTLPPRAALPDDATCAKLVTPAPELVPANARYNATAGTQSLPAGYFDDGSYDLKAITEIAPRVTGRYTGTTTEIMEWIACKWGIDEDLVRAQAWAESSWRQQMVGDWTKDATACVPGHGLGVDGVAGQCPESWGLLQIKYQFFKGAFPDAMRSTAFNADAAYAVWRSCYEGYEHWLAEPDSSEPGYVYRAGDALGCMGRWFSGAWYTKLARDYMACMQLLVDGRGPCPENGNGAGVA